MRRFWNMLVPLCSPDPDPLIPPTVDPPPVVDPPRRARQVTCEFCECRLTPDGEIIRMGAAAKEFRDLREELDDTRRSVAALESDNERLKRELAEARALLTSAEKETSRKLIRWGE